jgi:hypothetical protein
MNIILIGHGRMGRLIEEEAQAAGHTVAGIYDRANLEALDAVSGKADAAIDFSGPQSLPAVLRFVRRTGTRASSLAPPATPTSRARADQPRSAPSRAVHLDSANFSLGVAVLRRVTAEALLAARSSGWDVEIVEIAPQPEGRRAERAPRSMLRSTPSTPRARGGCPSTGAKAWSAQRPPGRDRDPQPARRHGGGHARRSTSSGTDEERWSSPTARASRQHLRARGARAASKAASSPRAPAATAFDQPHVSATSR